MAGIEAGTMTLIWYMPTSPGVRPAKTGPGVNIGAPGVRISGLIYGRDGPALTRKSNCR
jgi:hypothetical protein